MFHFSYYLHTLYLQYSVQGFKKDDITKIVPLPERFSYDSSSIKDVTNHKGNLAYFIEEFISHYGVAVFWINNDKIFIFSANPEYQVR